MGMQATAAAKTKRLATTRDWKRKKRAEGDPKYVAKERKSCEKYNNFTRLCKLFVKTYPDAFNVFCIAHNKGMARAPISRSASSSPMLPTSPPIMPPPSKPQSNILQSLGIALD
jgi:hypothetical protein